ncbi:MAG: outer membrane protein assembly factor BamB family protein [Promethearchaeota archaeon]
MQIKTFRISRKIILFAMLVFVVVGINSIPRDALDQVVENQNFYPTELNEEIPLNSEGGIQLDWIFNEGVGLSSAAIGDIDEDGTIEVVVGSLDNNVYALNGEDGTIQWSFTTGDDVLSSPALGDIDNDGTIEIVIGSTDGTLYALNGEDGTQQWNATGANYIDSNPAIGDIDGDGTIEVIFEGPVSHLYVLNGEDGTFQWSFNAMGPPSSPAVGDVDGDGTMEVVISSGHRIFVINAEDGSFEWDYFADDWIFVSPAIGDVDGDGTIEILFGSRDYKIYAINGEDGTQQWNYTTGYEVEDSSPALGDVDGDGTMEVIIGSCDGKLYAINGEDGSLQWDYTTGGEIHSSPALADIDGDGTIEILVGSNDNKLYAINGKDGTLQWAYTTSDDVTGSPVIGNIDVDDNLEILVGSWYYNFYALEPTNIVGQQRVEWQGLHGDLNFTNTRNHRYIDPDRDFLSNQSEVLFNTNPLINDTDGDSILDGTEVSNGLNPNIANLGDLDFDGLSDIVEVNIYFTNPFNNDTDGDSILDGTEAANGLNPNIPNIGDLDSDGLSDVDEVNIYFTNPLNNDTDGDSLDDWDELFIYPTNATNPDTDDDGLTDGDEILTYLTNPTNPDTDADGLTDGDEILTYLTDPTNPDTDGDGLDDWDEFFIYSTNATLPDTDGDGLDDWDEFFIYSTNATLPDTDGDGLDDGDEILTYLTNPTNPDTDADGLTDGDEIFTYQTNPSNPDTDADGLSDWDEIHVFSTNASNNDTDDDGLNDWDETFIYPTNATNPDTDGDGLDDWDELFIYPTNATNPDTDDDGVTDGDEILTYLSNPTNPDTDDDKITDGDEIFIYFTNPTNADTDGDGLSDWVELFFYITNPTNPDTDADGLDDWYETYIYPTNATNPDTDDDGVTDGDEILTYLTNATNPDTDADGLTDGDEIFTYLTNATNPDTDADGLNDWDEIHVFLTNANYNDTDYDGMPDGWEVFYNFDPLDSGDRELDADEDGRTNYGEFLDGTNATNPEEDTYNPTIIEISHTTNPTEYDYLIITIHCYDGSGIPEGGVILDFTFNGTQEIEIMIPINSTHYSMNLGKFVKGSEIQYNITVTDDSTNHNVVTSDSFTITILDGDFDPPSISYVDQTPNLPAEVHLVNIRCQVTDVDKGVGDVILNWRVNGGDWFQNIMNNFSTIDYQSQIGPFAVSDFVEYYIEAKDNSDYSNTQIYPISYNLNFTVLDSSGLDVDAPEILAFDYSPYSLIINRTLTINATITDVSGIKNATIYYRFGEGAWYSEEMINIQASDYSLSIGPILNDIVLYFYLEVIDISTYENVALKMNFGNSFFMIETIDLTLGEIFPESSELVGYEPFNIRVLDNDQNLNSFKKETIEIIITTTTDPIGKKYWLVETGINTALFTASIPIALIPDGISLEVNHGDIIHLMYFDPLNETGDPELVSRDIHWSMTTNAIILTNKTEYQTGDIVEITIFDNDINENITSIDTLAIRVSSELDFEGIFVVLYETGINTGIFVGTFEFNENLEIELIDAIKVFGSCDVFIEYIDAYQNGVLTIVHEIQFKSTNTDYSIYYTVLPEAPLNGDFIRIYARLGNVFNISLVQVLDENTGSITNLTYSQRVDSQYIYAGWVLAESEVLLFQFHLEITLFNGTIITTGSDQIPLLPTPMYVEWFPVDEEISGTVIILAKNRRGEVLNDVYFNISASSPFMDESIQLVYEESSSGEFIFSFAMDSGLDVGRYLIEITASKPGYFDGKTQLILVLVYGAEVFEGMNIVEGEGIIYEVNASQHCWLIMESVITPISTTMELSAGYVPLDGSFINVYSMSKDDENSGAFTEITINLLIDETSIDISDLMVYFSTDSENWVSISFIHTLNGEDETRWIQFNIPSEGVFGIVVPHDQLPHRNDEESTTLAINNYNLDNFNVVIELVSNRANPITDSEFDGQNSNLTQDLEYILIAIQVMAIITIVLNFGKSKIKGKNTA